MKQIKKVKNSSEPVDIKLTYSTFTFSTSSSVLHAISPSLSRWAEDQCHEL